MTRAPRPSLPAAPSALYSLSFPTELQTYRRGSIKAHCILIGLAAGPQSELRTIEPACFHSVCVCVRVRNNGDLETDDVSLTDCVDFYFLFTAPAVSLPCLLDPTNKRFFLSVLRPPASRSELEKSPQRDQEHLILPLGPQRLAQQLGGRRPHPR